MASHYEAPIRRPLVTGEKSYHDVTWTLLHLLKEKQTNYGG